MAQKQFPISLAQLVVLEGQSRLDEVEEDYADLHRVRVARLVTEQYRPARKLQFSGDPNDKNLGNKQMRDFAEQSLELAIACEEAGDMNAARLARHNSASAYGTMCWFSNQYWLNKAIVNECWSAHDRLADMDDDTFFVFSKAFVGMVENNEAFREHVGLEKWFEFVEQFEERRFADFPGRALAFVRALSMGKATDEHIDLLRQAATCDFGKDDQKRDVVAYLASLGE